MTSDKKRVAVSNRGGVALAVTLSDGRFIMTIGTLSVSLTRSAAEEIVCLLADALEEDDPLWSISATSN